MEEFADHPLPCRDCGQSFVWTAGEQRFFHENGLINLPVRCAACRTIRKARLGLEDRAQTEVVCADCGKTTTVPFVPRNGNPVYCSRCFDRRRLEARTLAPAEGGGDRSPGSETVVDGQDFGQGGNQSSSR